MAPNPRPRVGVTERLVCDEEDADRGNESERGESGNDRGDRHQRQQHDRRDRPAVSPATTVTQPQRDVSREVQAKPTAQADGLDRVERVLDMAERRLHHEGKQDDARDQREMQV